MPTLIARAVALVVVLLGLAPAAASAASQPRNFVYRVVSIEHRYQWTDQSRSYPENCASWLKGGGTITASTEPYSGLLQLDEYYPGKYYGSSSKKGQAEVTRRIEYRGHLMPDEGCTPCGPSSEYGQCRPTKPDSQVKQTCGPRKASTGTVLRAQDRALVFGTFAGFAAALRRCPEPDDNADTGPEQPEFGRLQAATGVRQLMGLRVGERRTIVFETRRGRCSKVGQRGMHVCAIATAKVNFRRSF